MENILETLDSSIQAKVDADTDFQTSIADLPEEEKTQKIDARKKELLNGELASLREKAAKAEKAEEIANNQKIRAEKAEAAMKGKGEPQKPPEEKEKGLSPKDMLALGEAKVSSEDLDEVLNYASFRKLSVAEALKDKTMQTILKEKQEERATAAAMRGGGVKPIEKEKVGEKLLNQAVQQEMVPDESDDAGIAALAEARFQSRKGKAKI